MIVRSHQRELDGNWQLVQYDTDEQGRCKPELRKSDMDAEIAVFHEQRRKELRRLHGRLMAGELSPVGFFVELQRMSPEDLAPRMRLRASVVRGHCTPAKFGQVTVEQLQRYARIFDVAVGDFFQLVELCEEVPVEVRSAQAGLVQHVQIGATAAPDGARS
jgi:hypothetical protein